MTVATQSLENIVTEEVFDIYRRALDFYRSSDSRVNGVWKKTDSISGGRLGLLFFMLELFSVTRDEGVWNELLYELEWMEQYMTEHPTNNYTLFQGRLGMGLFYLQLFRLTDRQEFLDKSTLLAKEYYESNSFRNSIITKHGLFDGIAGILLFTHELYLHTGHLWLLEHIEKYTEKLLYTCFQGRVGIFWGGVTNLHEKNNGYATGTAGVAFVLNRLGNSFGNELLGAIAQEAFAYENSCRDEAHRRPGTVLAAGGEDLLMTKGWCFLPESGQLAERLTLIYRERKDALPWTLEGALGVGYFLLNAAKPADKRVTLLVMPEGGLMADPAWLPATSVFQPGNTELAERYIRSSYDQTLSAISSTMPDACQAFMARGQGARLSAFTAFAEDEIASRESHPAMDSLLFQFEKEKFEVALIRQLNEKDAYDANNISEMDRIMHLGPAEFRELQLVQSEKIWIFSKESLDIETTKFNGESFAGFMESYGLSSFFYAISSMDRLHVGPMGMVKFIFDRYASPVRVQEVSDKLMRFFCSQGEEILGMMRAALQAKDDQQLKEMIDNMAVEGTKYCIAEGLLESPPILSER